MMNLHTLKPAKGSTKSGKRIARGEGSGHGGTATKGHKGQKSRSGWSRKRNFEGGQMPLQMRLPKIGFKSPNRKEFVGLNLGRIQDIIDKHGLTEINLENLVNSKIVGKGDRIKILATGELTTKINISAHAFSASAKSAVEALGGTATIL